MKLSWHNEKRKVDDLIPYEKNPRQLSDVQAKQLTKSLTKFDLVEIPAIDTDNIIIAGHQRMKIMQLLGRGKEEIDVRVPNRKLTEKEFQEYNLRSNKNTGEFDFNILADFDIELLKDVGFDDLKFLDSEKPILNSETYQQKFAIIVEFENEEQQESLYNQLNEQGFKCKVMSI